MFALFASQNTALRCAARFKRTPPLLVRAAFLSMLADCNGDCFRRCLEQLTIYKYCPLFLSGTLFFKEEKKTPIANLGEEVPTRVAFLGEKELGFPFFGHKKSTWYTWSI